MNRMHRWNVAAGTTLAVLLLAGCASTGLVDKWSAPGFNDPMEEMLVIAIKKDEANRRIMEDAFVEELDRHGVNAVPSYSAFARGVPDTTQVREFLRARGIDGVLVAVALPEERELRQYPPYTVTEPVSVYDYWSGAYHVYYMDVVHRGATTVVEVVPHRVDVWSDNGSGGELVWSAETRSMDAASASEVSEEVTERIVPALADADIIPER